jgi:hypothetical protein
MRYIDYDTVTNPQSGDVYYNMPQDKYLVWDGQAQSWVEMAYEKETYSQKKTKILRYFEEDSNLYNDVMLEMRKRKLEKLKK